MPEQEERGRVRIWDKDWNCLVDERAADGDTASDVMQRAFENLNDGPASQ